MAPIFPYPNPPAGGLSRVATTGDGGFALQDATPNILEWTAPDDGNLHVVQLFSAMDVTIAATGGAVGVNLSVGGGVTVQPVFNGNLGVALYEGSNGYPLSYVVGPGVTVTMQQTSALTAGAATLYAELWAS